MKSRMGPSHEGINDVTRTELELELETLSHVEI